MPAAVYFSTASHGLLLPALLLCALSGLIVAQLGNVRVPQFAAAAPAPPTTIIAPRSYSYRDSGDYQRGSVNIDAPLVSIAAPASLEITTYQVTITDYDRCVAAGGCEKAQPRRKLQGNAPVTGVSFTDAEAYARWLSTVTGDTWRLPSVAEWDFAAGSRASDDALNLPDNFGNPAARWLAEYERQSRFDAATLAAPEPLGHFGFNEFGIADLAGSVWEWTTSCGGRTTLGTSGEIISKLDSCGVRYLEGKHRMPMNVFVRDGRTGGCSVSAPPDNLGFRLVREHPWYAPIITGLQALFG